MLESCYRNKGTGNWHDMLFELQRQLWGGSTSQACLSLNFFSRHRHIRTVFSEQWSLLESLDLFFNPLRQQFICRYYQYSLWFNRCFFQIRPTLKHDDNLSMPSHLCVSFTDLYCTLEVDSFGYFVSKAKTRVFRDTTEPQWNEVRLLPPNCLIISCSIFDFICIFCYDSLTGVRDWAGGLTVPAHPVLWEMLRQIQAQQGRQRDCGQDHGQGASAGRMNTLYSVCYLLTVSSITLGMCGTLCFMVLQGYFCFLARPNSIMWPGEQYLLHQCYCYCHHPLCLTWH